MRRTALFFTLPLLPVFAGALVAACSSDDNGGVHGEVFDIDGGSQPDGTTILGDGSFVSPDGSPQNDGSTISPDGGTACTSGTIAIVGGGASSAFASTSTGTGAFTTQSFSAVGVAALPSVVSFGTGFQAVFNAAGTNALNATSYASPTWSTPAAIAGTYALEMPTLAVVGTTLHLVYEGNFDDAGGLDSHDYFHGTLSGSTWSANDPVGTANVNQSFGPHSLGAAGLATELVTGQVGSNNNVYARSLSGGTWAASVDIVSSGNLGDDGTSGTAPRLVALTSGPEILAVYTRQTDYKLMAITRTGGTWQSTATLIDTNDYTTEPFNLVALPGGKAIVTWRGSNTFGYASVFNGTTWSTPATALTSFAINSAPAISVGDCGSVAVAAYAKAAGTVEMIRYDGTSWGTAQAVTGASGATYVAIASSP
jgi:hypothetical protein